jgi:hypothetical protein
LRPLSAVVVSLVTLLSATAAGDDLSHVSDDELAQEAHSRAADIQRTAERIAALEIEELELAIALEDARDQVRRIEDRLERRVELLYRLTRRGAALRYLVAASSATDFLKRLRTLRHLVLEGLEDRRRAGARVAETEERMVAVRREQGSAAEMLTQLEATQRELLEEQSRRARDSRAATDR